MDNPRTSLSDSRFGDISLGIVCPMANESTTAVKFVNAVLARCEGFREVVFFAVLDNVCKDGTAKLMKDLAKEQLQLNVVWAPENTCIADAYVRGYREALGAGCDWVLEIDAGFSHQPEDMPRFLDKMLEGYDCVFGSRFCKGGSMTESPVGRRIVSRGGTICANVLLGTKLTDMTSGFEMFSRSALEMVLARGIKSRAHFFQTEIKVYCRKLKIAEVPIRYRAPSVSVNKDVLKDAMGNLFRLFMLRLSGKL
ncbi:MAG: glycosyltransferase [Planctomycetota bacterium]|jgi:dolichol-phosphate mannosyltransferase